MGMVEMPELEMLEEEEGEIGEELVNRPRQGGVADSAFRLGRIVYRLGNISNSELLKKNWYPEKSSQHPGKSSKAPGTYISNSGLL